MTPDYHYREDLAAMVIRAWKTYETVRGECAHLCGCARASGLVDSAVVVALDIGGWGYGTLAERVGRSKAAIQKRATKGRHPTGGHHRATK